MIYTAKPGEMFYAFIQRMQYEMESNRKGSNYRNCIFNDTYFIISADSNLDDICTIYDLKRENDRLKNK